MIKSLIRYMIDNFMKKEYIFYLLVLFSVFAAVIIIWPHFWVNLDIGAFHYHRLWKGPNLDDLSGGRYEYNFDLELGKDFSERSNLLYKVNFDDNSVDKREKIEEVVGMLQNRLRDIGYSESVVGFYKKEDNYFITSEIEEGSSEIGDNKEVIFSKGKMEFWGEKGEEIVAEEDDEDSEEESDPLREYIKENFVNLGIDGNEIKGYKTGEADESSYLRVVLEEEQSKNLTNQIYSFYGKSLIIVIDDQVFYIDGSDLSETVQIYQEAKSIKIAGIPDEEQANLYGSVVKNGPLPVDLEFVESTDLSPLYDKDILRIVLIAIIGIFILFSFGYILLFKLNGAVGMICVGLYLLFTIALLKIVPIKITSGVIFSLLITISSYIGVLSLSLKSMFNKKEDGEDKILFLTDKKVENLFDNIVIISLIFSFVLILFAVWQMKYIGIIILTGSMLALVIHKGIYPFCYKFMNFIKR